MAIPGMDLQAQYEQTLQNTIGKSQRDRLQEVRKQQTLANTDWSQRGVGQGAQRLAGFQEVNPSSMPNMSDETRSFIKPLLGTYQEGGRNVEGYYGKENPYTQSGLESILTKQGYARAPTSLSEQFKSVGLKLPNAYGQDYYNANHEALGNDISKYTQQNDPYRSQGFIPGQDNGDWKWVNGAGPQAMLLELAFANQNSGAVDSDGIPFIRNQEELAADKWRQDYLSTVSPEGSGTWYNDKDPMHGIDYRPGQGYSYTEYDSAPKGFNKYMPALTMAALGAMTGGAGTLIGGGAGTVGGALAGGVGSAIPTTMQTGLTTGDWGRALAQGGISALAGGLGGAYGGDLSTALGMSGKLGEGVSRGLISGAVNTAGNALLGNKIDAKNVLANTLSNIAAPYLGDLTKNAIGGTGGDILGGAVGGFSGNALKNILQGKSLDIKTAIDTFSGATGGLGKLFSDTNDDKQGVYGPTSLAKTIEGTKNASTKNWRT